MVGTRHRLTVESLANSGDGVGHVQDQVVFIPFSCPGDDLEVEITEKKKRFLKAKIHQILRPSPQRIPAPCEYFQLCGGCTWQHINYQEQLKWKQHQLVETLKRLGKINNPPVASIIACDQPFHYRNRIQLQVTPKGFAYRKKESHDFVTIKKCLIADEKINQHLTPIFASLDQSHGKVELATMGERVETFKVHSKGQSELGFRQVNSQQNQNLVNLTVDVVKKYNIRSIVDLYCGQGNWSHVISQSVTEAYCLGIDSNPININIANENKSDNCEFLLGKVEDQYKSLAPGEQLVVVDPPRAGCTPSVINAITERKPEWLIYMSCHPATLSRDLQNFVQKGWELEKIVPLDMFPQTAHLECWTLLRGGTRLNTDI